MSLGNLIKESGKTKEEVAFRTGVPFDTLTKHLNGWRGIGVYCARKYAEYFECSIEDILADAPERKKRIVKPKKRRRRK